MAVDGINKWTPLQEGGGIPRVSAKFSQNMENEQDDTGRDGRTCLAMRPNSKVRTRTGKRSLSQSSSPRTGLPTLPD